MREPGFGQRVKAVRKHLKLNQTEMAEKLNITMTTLSDIERGKSYPCFDFFYNMVEHFNVNLYYLLFGRGEMLVLPGTDSPPDKEKVKNENEMTLIVDRKDIREFLHYFSRSRLVQYRVMGEFYRFFNTDRQSIEMDIEAIEKEKNERKK